MGDEVISHPRRFAGWQSTAIAVILIVAAATYLGPILKPLLSAVFVYFLIRPYADWLKRRGLAGWLAYALLFLGASGAVLGSLWVLIVNAVHFKADWPIYEPRLVDLATHWGYEAQIREGVALITPQALIGSVVTPAAQAAEFGLMLIFYLLFLILSTPKFVPRIRRSLAPDHAERMIAISTAIADGMSRYMKVKTGINAGLAATFGLVLAFFGIDYWPLWTVLMFALNYITYIGAVVALVPPIALGFAQLPPATAGILTAILLAVRFVWIDVLEVKLSGRHLNIDSILLLVFMAYWGWAWGFIGLVLAMPMATCLRSALAAEEATQPLAGLMSED